MWSFEFVELLEKWTILVSENFQVRILKPRNPLYVDTYYRAAIKIQDWNETWPIGYLIDRISSLRIGRFAPVVVQGQFNPLFRHIIV